MEKIGRIHTKKPESMWKFCDEIAAAFCIDPSIVLEYINVVSGWGEGMRSIVRMVRGW